MVISVPQFLRAAGFYQAMVQTPSGRKVVGADWAHAFGPATD
ncbi:MAG: hypothetical protein O2910_02385 [Proteobacteria bacterium]|jgi:hypothetical protein|nr:hypothetical protein [Pseudomonadota bacterium]|tara:strand:+ start:676 stop:801 length:126 start_codon:yes stop_codon:yes gene_type:complete